MATQAAGAEEAVPLLHNTSVNGIDEDKYPGKTSLSGSIFNLANSAIGSGILAFPYAFSQSGLALGVICTALLAAFIAFSLVLIAYGTAKQRNPNVNSYEKLVESIFGKKGAILTTICIILNIFGAAIIMGQLLTPLMAYWLGADHILAQRPFLLAMLAIFIVYPISALPRIDHLKFSSTFAIFSITFVVIVILVRGIQHVAQNGVDSSQVTLFQWKLSIFEALPLFTFALGCNLQCPAIYQEMVNRSMARMHVAIITTEAFCTLLYSTVGLFGYLTFYGDIDDNVLTNYGMTDVLADIARVAVTLTVMSAYAMCNYVGRVLREDKYRLGRLAVESAIVLCCAYGVAILIPDISIVFGLSGSTVAVVTIFFFPPAFYFKLDGVSFNPTTIFCFLLISVGVLIFCVSTALNVQKALSLFA